MSTLRCGVKIVDRFLLFGTSRLFLFLCSNFPARSRREFPTVTLFFVFFCSKYHLSPLPGSDSPIQYRSDTWRKGHGESWCSPSFINQLIGNKSGSTTHPWSSCSRSQSLDFLTAHNLQLTRDWAQRTRSTAAKPKVHKQRLISKKTWSQVAAV